jgi:hypothetical protein
MFIGFDNWKDVSDQFTGTYSWSDTKPTPIPEPEEVIVANYETASYEGHALVVFRNGEKFYTVDGSHCSCYGLEGQWEPEEYDTPELLLAALKKASYNAEPYNHVIGFLEAYIIHHK